VKINLVANVPLGDVLDLCAGGVRQSSPARRTRTVSNVARAPKRHANAEKRKRSAFLPRLYTVLDS
jgi:hypothetical protein